MADKHKILIVEDDKYIINFISMSLKKEDYDYVIAKTCGEANALFYANRPDMIILDPPRDGIHPKALPKILAYGVENIVYISCKPTSLARDLPAFLAAGYEVQRSCSVDQFCETVHVETVVKLVRKAPDAYIDITVDMDELDLTASEAKATYEEIKQYILDKYDTKVSNLYIAQVKEKYGIIERENYNKPKSENSKQPQCPAEKVEMIEEALRDFKMI